MNKKTKSFIVDLIYRNIEIDECYLREGISEDDNGYFDINNQSEEWNDLYQNFLSMQDALLVLGYKSSYNIQGYIDRKNLNKSNKLRNDRLNAISERINRGE
tara:strand:- start:342 stop:647 length:306 start_codon:yes stop_codon:yes gene_type:complete